MCPSSLQPCAACDWLHVTFSQASSSNLYADIEELHFTENQTSLTSEWFSRHVIKGVKKQDIGVFEKHL